jgi:phosphoglycolate phosphatase
MGEQMNGRIRSVIFDLDGTLVDSAPAILNCMETALSSFGISPVLPLTNVLIGPPLKESLQKISGVDDAFKIEAMAQKFKEHYDTEGYRQTSAFPDIDRLLQRLFASGIRLYIATNKRLVPTEKILQHLAWVDLFAGIYATDSREPAFSSKGEMIEFLLNTEQLGHDRAIYVGDRKDDAVAASVNGIEFVAVAWGYSDFERLEDSGYF